MNQSIKDDEYEEIHQAFKRIKQKYRDDLGEKDVRYIKKIRRNSRIFEVIGRTLIHISPGPLPFLVCLSYFYIVILKR